MATIRELVVRFGFDVDEAPLQKMEEAIDSIKSGLIAVGTAAVSAAAGLFGIAKTTADAADQIRDTSIALGVSYDSLQRLGYAASLSGASQEMLADGMRHLAKAALEARDSGSEISKALRRLGVSAVDSAGKLRAPDDLLYSLSDAFKRLPPGVEKSALSMQFFGRSGNQLVQFLDEGSSGLRALGAEAAELGIIMDEAAIQAGAEFNDELDRLTAVAKGVARQIGTGLIPVIEEIMQGVRAWVLANRELIKTRITAFVEMLSKFLSQLWRVASAVWTVFRGMVSAIDTVTKSIGGFAGVLKVLAGTIGLFALGRLGLAIFDVAKGFVAIGRAAIFAWRSALLGPILIGAAIVGAFLVVEDFLAWLDGRPSTLGFLIANKDEILATLLGWFHKARAIVYKALKTITVAFLEFFGVPRDEAERAFDSFAGAVSKASKLALEFLSPLLRFFQVLLGAAIDGVILLCQGLAQAFVALATDPKQALSDFADFVGDVIKGALLSVFDVVRNLTNAILEMFGIDTSAFAAAWDVLEQIVSGWIDSVFGYFGKLRDGWLALIRNLVSAFTALFEGDFLGFFARLGQAIFQLVSDSTRAFAALIRDVLKGTVGKLAAAVGIDLFGPDPVGQAGNVAGAARAPFSQSVPVPPAAPIGGSSSETSVQSQITVNVPPGSDAQAIAESVRQAANEEFSRLLRPAGRAVAPGVQY